MPTVVLTVATANERDALLGRARLDSVARRELGVRTGEVIEIVGRRPTPATAYELPEEEEGKGIVRLDAFVRLSAGTDLGEQVEVRTTRVQQARRVVLVPIASEGYHIMIVGPGMRDRAKRQLFMRPVSKGDILAVPGLSLAAPVPKGDIAAVPGFFSPNGPLPLLAETTDPDGVVQIRENTEIEIVEGQISERDLKA